MEGAGGGSGVKGESHMTDNCERITRRNEELRAQARALFDEVNKPWGERTHAEQLDWMQCRFRNIASETEAK